MTPFRSSTEKEVASPVVPRTLRPSHPLSSRWRAKATARLRSGAPLSSIGVAIAAITPDSVLVTSVLQFSCHARPHARPPRLPASKTLMAGTSPAMTDDVSSTDIIRSKRGHIDELIVLGAQLHDLHRSVETDKKRTDDRGTAEFLQHFRRDRSGMERRHDQHIGRAGETAERIGRRQLRIERHVGGHFAIVFEIDALAVENFYGFNDACRTFTLRMSESREGEQRQARFIAKTTRHARRLNGDFGNLMRLGHFRHRCIGNQNRTSPRNDDRNSDDPMSGFGVDDTTDVFECDRKIAGDAGDHGIGVTKRDHARCEMIAVLVYQPLTITHQEAAPLQPLVEEIDVGGVAGRKPCVDDLDTLTKFDAGFRRGLAHAILTAYQQRGAETLMHEAACCADDLLFLALRKDHALGLAP